jgi:two-component system response regulator AgrA
MEKVIKGIIEKHSIEARRVEIFGKPEQLLASVTEKGSHQLFFLDIEIKDNDKKGLEIGRQLRQLDPNAIIVFVTTHTEFMPLSFRYQVMAWDYIDKERLDQVFNQQVEKSILHVHQLNGQSLSEQSFYYNSKFAQVQIPFNDILYIETSPHSHRVILYTVDERMEFTASLSEIMKQEQRLFQCHRSFLVNLHNVVKVDKTTRIAYFSNGYHCFIARNKLNNLLKTIDNLHRGKENG